MSEPPLTQWYTNRAEAKRGARGDVMALVEHRGRWLSFYVPATDPNGIGLLARVAQVEHHSAEQIDRLARDWIAHGVAPTLRHERGVGTEADCTCDPWSPDGHESHCAMLAWCRKERRARRVVRVQL